MMGYVNAEFNSMSYYCCVLGNLLIFNYVNFAHSRRFCYEMEYSKLGIMFRIVTPDMKVGQSTLNWITHRRSDYMRRTGT